MVELSRRQLLGAAAVAGSATALAACSPTMPAENIDTSGPHTACRTCGRIHR